MKGNLIKYIASALICVCLMMMAITERSVFLYAVIGISILFILRPEVVFTAYFISSLSGGYFSVGSLGASRVLSILLIVSLLLQWRKLSGISRRLFLFELLILLYSLFSCLFSVTGQMSSFLVMLQCLLVTFLLQQAVKLDTELLTYLIIISSAIAIVMLGVHMIQDSALLFEERYSGVEDTNTNKFAMMCAQLGAVMIGAFVYLTRRPLLQPRTGGTVPPADRRHLSRRSKRQRLAQGRRLSEARADQQSGDCPPTRRSEQHSHHVGRRRHPRRRLRRYLLGHRGDGTLLNKLIKISSLAIYAISIVIIVLSGSRSALVGLLVASLFVVFFTQTGGVKKAILPVALIALVGVGLVYFFSSIDSPILERFTLEDVMDDGGSGRLYYARQIYDEVILRHPFFGVGMGGQNVMALGIEKQAHNIVIDPVSQLGIVGFVIYLCFIVPIIVRALKLRNKNPFIIIPLTLFFTGLFNGIGEVVFYEKLFWNSLALCALVVSQSSIKKRRYVVVDKSLTKQDGEQV